MTRLSKNIYQPPTALQLLSRVIVAGRGKAIVDRARANPAPPLAELTRLQQELSGLVSAEGQAAADAAFARGDFWTDPPGRVWPSTVFTAGETTFGKSLTAALEEIRK